jgi:hypothetical protein
MTSATPAKVDVAARLAASRSAAVIAGADLTAGQDELLAQLITELLPAIRRVSP